MKLVAERQEKADIKSDPKTKDRVSWHYIQNLVDIEACHRDWNVALYKLHRIGRINNDQREAGDKYAALIRDRRKLWRDPMGSIEVHRSQGMDSLEKRTAATADVEYLLGVAAAGDMREESEFETKRAQRISLRYNEAKGIVGRANSILEDLLIDDVWPVGERGHVEIGHALTRLSHFFNTGTKRKR